MKKIPTLFVRDFDNNPGRVLNEVNPSCQWVIDGEGIATRKLDGMGCAVIDGRAVKRREIKANKPVPDDFIQADYDVTTEKKIGWVPIKFIPDDQWFIDGLKNAAALYLRNNRDKPPHAFPGIPDGFYELVGPKSQGGAEKDFSQNIWIWHGQWNLRVAGIDPPPREFDALRTWMDGRDIEGVVWHHPDGRMAKIKQKDFGLKRPS